MTAPATSGETVGNLKQQWKLVREAGRDRRLKSCLQVAVLIEVIDRFYKTRGSGTAPSRYLMKVLGADRRNVRDALSKLVELGYLAEVRKGGYGRISTEYRPNFELPRGGTRTPSMGIDSRGGTRTPSEGALEPPLNGVEGALEPPVTYLLSPAYTGVQVSRYPDGEGTPGAATPPPACAPVGAAGVPPGAPVVAAGFNELWAVYPRQFQKPKAKAAYAKLNPDAALHADMLAGAHALAAHIQANGGDISKCPFPANWIEGERWDEDPAAGYVDRKPKVAAVTNRGRKEGSKKPAADSKPTTPTADVRRDVSHAEKMKRAAEYARATNDTVDGLRWAFGCEHDDDGLYSSVWENANLDWPSDVPAPSWVVNGGKLPDWTDSDAWADFAVAIDSPLETVLYRRVQTAGGCVDQDENYSDSIHLPAQLAGHPAVADIIKSANALYIDVHVGDVAYPHTTPEVKPLQCAVETAATVNGSAGDPDQPTNGAASTPTTPPWNDYDAWSARVDAVGGNRVRALIEWVKLAGGSADRGGFSIPAGLPDSYAWTVMRGYADDLEIDFRMGKPAASKATPAAPAPRPSTAEPQSAALTPPTPPAEPPTLPKATPPTPAPPAPNWADHAAWAARFDGACSTREHHTVIGEWAESAGGYVGGFDNDQIWLPAGCRADPAWHEIADRALALGLGVHTDPPAPTTTTGPFTRAPASP